MNKNITDIINQQKVTIQKKFEDSVALVEKLKKQFNYSQKELEALIANIKICQKEFLDSLNPDFADRVVTWNEDNDSSTWLFKQCDKATRFADNLYTSIQYVAAPNTSPRDKLKRINQFKHQAIDAKFSPKAKRATKAIGVGLGTVAVSSLYFYGVGAFAASVASGGVFGMAFLAAGIALIGVVIAKLWYHGSTNTNYQNRLKHDQTLWQQKTEAFSTVKALAPKLTLKSSESHDVCVA